MKNNYLSNYATRASAKTRKTKIYTPQQLSDLRALIESYFTQHHPDIELNTNEANYTPLVDAINKQQQKEVLKTRFVCDLFNSYGTSIKKSIAKIEAIEKYINTALNIPIKKDTAIKPLNQIEDYNQTASHIHNTHPGRIGFDEKFKSYEGVNFLRSQYQYWVKAAEKNSDLSKRIEIYNEALLELPDNEVILLDLGCAYYETGRYEEAERCNRYALSLYPNNADLHSNHALYLHIIAKDYENAEKHFKKALHLQPEHINNNAHYGWFLQSIRKDYRKAEEQYKIALKVNPNNPAALHNYGWQLCFIQFNIEKGIAYLEKVNTLYPNDATVLGNLAFAFTSYELDLAKAKKYFQIATELDPTNPVKHANFAQLLFAIGKKNEALKCIELARKYSNTDKELLLELQFYLYAHCTEMMNKAKRHLQELLNNGFTSEYKNFSVNIKTAIENGHPDIPTLIKFAEAISGFKYQENGQAILPKVV
jgi:Tfp pilus assembly protein PilF